MASSSDPDADTYLPDPLGPDFELRHLPQPTDYEGTVRTTLVRYRKAPAVGRAVLYVHGVTKLGAFLPDLKLPASLSDAYGQSLHRAYRGQWDYDLAWKPNRVFHINAGWLRAIRAGHRQVRRGLNLPVPVLVLHSDRTGRGRKWSDDFHRADIVLDVAHIRQLSPRLGSKVTVKAVEGGIHDLFLSAPPARAAAYQVVFEWLDAVLPPKPATVLPTQNSQAKELNS